MKEKMGLDKSIILSLVQRLLANSFVNFEISKRKVKKK